MIYLILAAAMFISFSIGYFSGLTSVFRFIQFIHYSRELGEHEEADKLENKMAALISKMPPFK